MTLSSLNRIKKLLTALLLAALAGVLVFINIKGATEENEAADGRYFADMHLETFSGGTYTGADVSRDLLTVFTVWNPYCTACVKEMPLLDRLDREYAEKGVRIVGIEGEAFLYPEDIEKSRALYAETGAEFTQLLADEDFTNEILPILNNAYPGTFLVDSRGVIRDFKAGSMEENEWRAWIDTALALNINTVPGAK